MRGLIDRLVASAREPGTAPRAIRTAICLAVPVAVGLIAGAPASGAVASFGSFVGFYAHREPYRWRAGLLAGLAFGFAVAVAVGTLAAPSTLATALAPAAFAAVATFVCIGIELAPPREYLMVLVCLASTGLPADPGAWASRAGLALAGAGFAWLVTMSGGLWEPRRPERQALVAALDRVEAALDKPESVERRRDAVRSVRTARHAILRAGPGREDFRAALLGLEELLSAALSVGFVGEAEPTRRRIDLARADIEAAEERRGEAPEELRVLSAPQMLRAAASARSLAPPTAARMGIAIAIAGGAGAAIHATNGYWIPLTVAAALQGTSPFHARRRALERAGGTAVGAVFASGLIALGPAPGAIVAIIAVLQALTETAVPVFYALGVALLTPIPILLLHVADPQPAVGHFVVARLLDTAIGCAIAILVAATIWPRAAQRRLAEADRAGFTAAAELILALTMAPGPQKPGLVERGRRRAQAATVAMRVLVDASLGERGGPGAAVEGPGVERLLMLAIGAGAEAHAMSEPGRAELAAALARIEAALPSAPDPPPAVPDIPGLPRTTGELRHLAAPST
ncbi:MAG: FUSC family protein [Solirubrobacterales bacterium]